MQISSDIDNVLLSDLYWLCIAKKKKNWQRNNRFASKIKSKSDAIKM